MGHLYPYSYMDIFICHSIFLRHSLFYANIPELLLNLLQYFFFLSFQSFWIYIIQLSPVSHISSHSYSRYHHLVICRLLSQGQTRNSVIYPPSDYMTVSRGLETISGSVYCVILIFRESILLKLYHMFLKPGVCTQRVVLWYWYRSFIKIQTN